MKWLLLVLIFSVQFGGCGGCGGSENKNIKNGDAKSANQNVNVSGNINVALGVPTDSDSSDDYLIYRAQYVISYNKNKNVANWVSWNLDKEWFGTVARHTGAFISDTTLPIGFFRPKDSDYNKCGYDRGHLVRSEERTMTEADNNSTFVLTNIIPQTPDLNRGVWLRFERYIEKLCKKEDKELYIIAGGIYRTQNTINGREAIPDSCFKIVVVLNKGQGLKDITSSTEIIAVVMPNIQGIRMDEWEKYRTTVRRIEGSTGYNFLSYVSKKIQDDIEIR